MNETAYNNITAQEAFDLAAAKLDEIDVAATLETCLTQIRSSAKEGHMQLWSPLMGHLAAEKLAYELDKLGFACGVQATNDTINGELQCVVSINWKWMPGNARERLR